jgi:hypothetical protein
VQATQQQLLGRVDQNGYKLARIYNMPCYSGFNGTVTLRNLPSTGVSFFQNRMSGYATSFGYSLNGQTDANGNNLYNTTFKVDWPSFWNQRAVYFWGYGGVNGLLIDWSWLWGNDYEHTF